MVELSDHSPHDISNVLKLYLRQVGLPGFKYYTYAAVGSVALAENSPPSRLQLPEPLVLYRYYNDLIGLAKECQRAIVEEADRLQNNPAGDKLGPNVQLNRVILKIRDFLQQLPTANYRTLHFLIAHLHR